MRQILPFTDVKLYLVTMSDRKGIRPVKSWVLVLWWWRFDWSFARPIAPDVTTTSIILNTNKTQNGDILLLANPSPPGKIAIKTETENVTTTTISSMQSANEHYLVSRGRLLALAGRLLLVLQSRLCDPAGRDYHEVLSSLNYQDGHQGHVAQHLHPVLHANNKCCM